MGNPDLELQNPERDPLRRHRRRTRRDGAAGRIYVAFAAGVLLTMGVWGFLAGASTALSLRQLLLRPLCLGSSPGGGLGVTAADGVAGAETDPFLQRRDAFAHVLRAEGVDAFLAEPGSIFEYYANISRADWEAFAPSQRPLLIVIQPEDGGGGSRTSLLAPRAQAGRVRALLRRVRATGVGVVAWEPSWDPYATLRKSRLFAPAGRGVRDHPQVREGADRRPVVMADPETRALVVDSLANAGFRYARLTPAVAGQLVGAPSRR